MLYVSLFASGVPGRIFKKLSIVAWAAFSFITRYKLSDSDILNSWARTISIDFERSIPCTADNVKQLFSLKRYSMHWYITSFTLRCFCNRCHIIKMLLKTKSICIIALVMFYVLNIKLFPNILHIINYIIVSCMQQWMNPLYLLNSTIFVCHRFMPMAFFMP